MLLGKLLKSVSKNYRKIPVGGISFDSRKVKKRDIFFAIKGNQTSGIKFINDALSNGASAIISSKKVKYKNRQIPLILVKNVRKSLSEACSNFYKKKPPNIVAVTGTNGKSSVADFFYQILSLNKISVASIGTLGVFSKNYNKKTNLTSMDSLSLHKNLQILARNKVNYVILEASSHGLQQKRLNNLNINTGIFTNLSHDHLDYHKSMKSYFNSKIFEFAETLTICLFCLYLLYKIFIFPEFVPIVIFFNFFLFAIFFINLNSLLSSSVIILEFFLSKFLNKCIFELK